MPHQGTRRQTTQNERRARFAPRTGASATASKIAPPRLIWRVGFAAWERAHQERRRQRPKARNGQPLRTAGLGVRAKDFYGLKALPKGPLGSDGAAEREMAYGDGERAFTGYRHQGSAGALPWCKSRKGRRSVRAVSHGVAVLPPQPPTKKHVGLQANHLENFLQVARLQWTASWRSIGLLRLNERATAT